ncbi:MAG TPA: AI-2E family transporter [Polyangiaceae bacterium]|nr:AI-2E family transporter [Polyangiaceae bacterium]
MPDYEPAPVPMRFARDAWTRARIVFLSVSLAGLVLLLFWAREVLLPFVLALVIAYVLAPLVAWFERRNIPRSASILLVYALVLGSLYYSIAAMAPRIYRETTGIVREVPMLVRKGAAAVGPAVDGWLERIVPSSPEAAEALSVPAAVEVRPSKNGGFDVNIGSGIEISQDSSNRLRIESTGSTREGRLHFSQIVDDAGDHILNYIKRNAMQIVAVGRAIVTYASRGIFLLFMTLMVAGYLMYTRESVIGFFRGLVPSASRLSFDRLLFRIERGLSGVVRGQLVICLVNGVLSAIGFWLFGLKYWPVLSLVAAVGSLIPIFGSILSTVPAVLIGLSQAFWTALWALLWVLGIHQLEANFLNPKIIGTAAKIHPCLVVFVLVVGEHFFGLWGALLAVPTWSILQSLFLHCRSLVIADAVDTVLPLFEAHHSSRPPAGASIGPSSSPSTSRGPFGPSEPPEGKES